MPVKLRPHFKAFYILCAVFFPLSPVLADQQDSLNFIAGASVQHENNLYRSIPGAEIDDLVKSANIGLDFDAQQSLQRFTGRALITNYVYKYNDDLDYQGRDLDAAWHWVISNRLKGKLSASYVEGLNSFEDYSGSSKNIRTTKSVRADAEFSLGSRWYVIGGTSYYDLDNSAIFLAESAYGADSIEYGLKYKTSLGSHIVAVIVNSEGEYTQRNLDYEVKIDTGFKQVLAELRFLWALSKKSALSARLGYKEREHNHFGERDFQGGVGRLGYTWDPSVKFRLQVTGLQDLSPYITTPAGDLLLYARSGRYYNSSYYKSQAVELTPIWQFAEKLSLQAQVKSQNRQFLGGLLDGLKTRKDVIRSLSLTLQWTPSPLAAFALRVQAHERSSNVRNSDFNADTARLSLNFLF